MIERENKMKFESTTNHEQSKINWYPDNPVTVYEFSVADDNNIVFNHTIEIKVNANKVHLEIVGNEDLSLLAVEEIVNLFETHAGNLEIEWNVALSSIILPKRVLVCSVVV